MTTLKSDFLEDTITVSKYALNQEQFYHLNESVPWVKDLLKELEGEAPTLAEGGNVTEGKMLVELSILRKHDTILLDHLIVSGRVIGTYQAVCVRCLEGIMTPLEIEFNGCFLHSSLEKTPEYEDVTEVYVDQKEMDLYFYEKGKINLKNLVHENIYLVCSPFPLHNEGCKGLCSVCGTNLNYNDCHHNP